MHTDVWVNGVNLKLALITAKFCYTFKCVITFDLGSGDKYFSLTLVMSYLNFRFCLAWLSNSTTDSSLSLGVGYLL